MEGSLIAGLVLILIGGFFLFERYMPNIDFSDFWPLLLILIGVIMIFRGFPGIGSKKDETISNEKDNLTNNDLNL
jgi:putative Mn2+ efflux pump MntP